MDKIASLILFSSLLMFTPAVNAADAIDPQKLINVLRSAKTIKAERPLNASVSGKQAIILTSRTAKATDKDCKIDAVLIAKELVTDFPEQVGRVRVIFSTEGSTKSAQVDVSAGDVKAFGLGALNVDSLMSSLDLVEVDTAAATAGTTGDGKALSVVPGPLLDKRLLLLSRIESMKARGTSVKPFMDIFNKLETEASAGQTEQLTKDLAYLSDKVSEQEGLLKQAKVRTSGAVNRAATVATLTNRCDEWDTKLKAWQLQGKDVTQVQLAISLVRGYISDPTKTSQAQEILNALDYRFQNGL